jgi:hypothetical protein
MSAQERKRREKERTTYCGKCDLMVYSIPIDVAIYSFSNEAHLRANLLKKPSRGPLFKQDKRYKSGYKTTSEFDSLCCYIFILLLVTGLAIAAIMYTFGIALIAEVPILYLAWRYFKKKNEKEKSKIRSVFDIGQSLTDSLREIQKNYQYICNRCFNGVELKKKPDTKKKKTKQNSAALICERCGTANSENSKFCVECGTSIEFIKASTKGRSRHIPAKIRYEVWMRDEGKCVRCKSKENLQFDHIIPFSKGGASTITNLQIMCQTCNLEKSDKIDG